MRPLTAALTGEDDSDLDPATPKATRAAALRSLNAMMNGLSYAAVLSPDEQSIIVAGHPADGTRTLTILAGYRRKCGGECWYFVSADEDEAALIPLAPTTEPINARMQIQAERWRSL